MEKNIEELIAIKKMMDIALDNEELDSYKSLKEAKLDIINTLWWQAVGRFDIEEKFPILKEYWDC